MGWMFQNEGKLFWIGWKSFGHNISTPFVIQKSRIMKKNIWIYIYMYIYKANLDHQNTTSRWDMTLILVMIIIIWYKEGSI